MNTYLSFPGVIAVLIIAATGEASARGQVPPPVFNGGSVGDWLGSGPPTPMCDCYASNMQLGVTSCYRIDIPVGVDTECNYNGQLGCTQ